MSLLTRIQKINRVHDLIKRKSTGTPKQFAQKLTISTSTLYQLIVDLKELGAPIRYCRHRESYEYGYEVKFHFGFVHINGMNVDELQKLSGGTKLIMNTPILLFKAATRNN